MREARIVMPHLPTPRSVEAHQKLRHSLVHAFGGYTATLGIGAWHNGDEIVDDQVTIYDVAMGTFVSNRAKLREIAVECGRDLGQKAVYIRYPSGHVEIVKTDTSQAEGEAVDLEDVDPETGPVILAGPAGVDEDAPDASVPDVVDGVEIRQSDVDRYSVATKNRTLARGFETAQEADAWRKRFLEAPLPGQKRLPGVGEVWETNDGARVAVLAQTSVLDGGYNVVTLTTGSHAMRAGFPYVVNLDGKFGRGSRGDESGHPLDLRRFAMRFKD